jgi:hypothetical protein
MKNKTPLVIHPPAINMQDGAIQEQKCTYLLGTSFEDRDFFKLSKTNA